MKNRNSETNVNCSLVLQGDSAIEKSGTFQFRFELREDGSGVLHVMRFLYFAWLCPVTTRYMCSTKHSLASQDLLLHVLLSLHELMVSYLL
jgi:hypothetical protein